MKPTSRIEKKKSAISPQKMKVLPVLGAVIVLIAGQDTKTVVFPPSGNGSSLEIGSTVEPVPQPDMTQGTVLAAFVQPQQPQPQPMLPSDYFFPGKDFSILVALRRCRLIILILYARL